MQSNLGRIGDQRGELFSKALGCIADEHGRDYLVWELRGTRVCVAAEQNPPPPTGIAQVVTGAARPMPFPAR